MPPDCRCGAASAGRRAPPNSLGYSGNVETRSCCPPPVVLTSYSTASTPCLLPQGSSAPTYTPRPVAQLRVGQPRASCCAQRLKAVCCCHTHATTRVKLATLPEYRQPHSLRHNTEVTQHPWLPNRGPPRLLGPEEAGPLEALPGHAHQLFSPENVRRLPITAAATGAHHFPLTAF